MLKCLQFVLIYFVDLFIVGWGGGSVCVCFCLFVLFCLFVYLFWGSGHWSNSLPFPIISNHGRGYGPVGSLQSNVPRSHGWSPMMYLTDNFVTVLILHNPCVLSSTEENTTSLSPSSLVTRSDYPPLLISEA